MSAKLSANCPTLAPQDLADSIPRLAGKRVLIVGDIMLDRYVSGAAERISPEAPVPIVRVEKEKSLVGGAGNVARNIAALGGTAVLVGVRGADAPGGDVERCLRRDGISHSLLSLEGRPTTVKTRVLAQRQQMLRIDREETGPLADKEIEALLELAAGEVKDCGAIVLSDYGKGVVTAGLMQGLRSLRHGKSRPVPLLVDPKPQNFSLYKNVTLLTPNAREASESVALPVSSPEEIVRAGRAILTASGSGHLVTTLGSRGMAVFEHAERVWHIPTSAVEVYDVTGAGDTVIAVLALGAAAELPLVHSSLLANYAAGIVVGQVGTAAATPAQLAEAIKSLPSPCVRRWPG
jgi:rfaE bifunctional protein kinase chain/domain